MSETIEAPALTDTELRLAVAEAAIAYVTCNTQPFSLRNTLAWERLAAAVWAWRSPDQLNKEHSNA